MRKWSHGQILLYLSTDDKCCGDLGQRFTIKSCIVVLGKDSTSDSPRDHEDEEKSEASTLGCESEVGDGFEKREGRSLLYYSTVLTSLKLFMKKKLITTYRSPPTIPQPNPSPFHVSRFASHLWVWVLTQFFFICWLDFFLKYSTFYLWFWISSVEYSRTHPSIQLSFASGDRCKLMSIWFLTAYLVRSSLVVLSIHLKPRIRSPTSLCAIWGVVSSFTPSSSPLLTRVSSKDWNLYIYISQSLFLSFFFFLVLGFWFNFRFTAFLVDPVLEVVELNRRALEHSRVSVRPHTSNIQVLKTLSYSSS